MRQQYGDEDDNIDQTFIQLNEEIDQLKADGSRKSEIEKEHNDMLKLIRADAMKQYDRKHNHQASPVEREQTEQRLEAPTLYFRIMELRDAWKDSADAMSIYSPRRTRDSFEGRTDSERENKYHRAKVVA